MSKSPSRRRVRTTLWGLGGGCDRAVAGDVSSAKTVRVSSRTGTVIVLALVALAATGLATAGTAGQAPGRLSGVTQISYGCPGPQRVGTVCERWSSFGHARFRLTTVSTGEARIVTSDRRGRFTILLSSGRYRLTPLRQAHTTGGASLTVTIRPAVTARVRVRFHGFPQML